MHRLFSGKVDVPRWLSRAQPFLAKFLSGAGFSKRLQVADLRKIEGGVEIF